MYNEDNEKKRVAASLTPSRFMRKQATSISNARTLHNAGVLASSSTAANPPIKTESVYDGSNGFGVTEGFGEMLLNEDFELNLNEPQRNYQADMSANTADTAVSDTGSLDILLTHPPAGNSSLGATAFGSAVSNNCFYYSSFRTPLMFDPILSSNIKFNKKTSSMVDEVLQLYNFGVEMNLMVPDAEIVKMLNILKGSFQRSVAYAANAPHLLNLQ